MALILLDLDGFKPINDTFGHPIGDQILIEVSRRLRDLGSGGLVVARLGGDEFAAVCKCEAAGQAVLVAQQAEANVSAPYRLDGREMRISACAGVSFQGGPISTTHFAAPTSRFMMRSVGCAEAFRFFPGRWSRTFGGAPRSSKRCASLVSEARFNSPSNRYSIFSRFSSARSRHSRAGGIPNWGGFHHRNSFRSVSRSACFRSSETLLARAAAAARRWPEAVSLSFNLSPVQLCAPETASNVLATIGRENLDASRLLVEITETALLADFEAARANLAQLGDAGVRIVLDDFGAGYSSISNLREMSFDAVKLDGTLLAAASEGRTGLCLLEGVLALCRAMGRLCVAEYIENDDQLQLLRRLSCTYGQGFGLCPPLSEPEADELIRSGVLRTGPVKNTGRALVRRAIG